ncbi:hypothetical protein XM38_022970 [Halomicronema hongdechloris C2206]|uniref:DUF3611 domain-containing protein n=1 Tax=Halomicronema hongdechloris C2206 TaxID=1641165 RepID=A0A1Z3HM38_9CYAN|nr:DUF3611 family protein [Halomicronema hongdechloris]ASC71345.1 hypothetical protein XM38_022970 [Halomicronema hongdechloris C2206]
MTGELDYSLPPAVRRISGNFRRFGWISFWAQLVLAIISSLVILFAIASGGAGSDNSTNVGTGGGLVLAMLGVAVVYGGAYWAFRYTRLARRLRSRDAAARPKPKDAMQALQTGLIVNLVGMLLTLLGAGAITGSLIGQSLRQQNVSGFNITQLVKPIDIFVVQANTNTLLAHFIGIVATLWLLRTISRA